MLSIKNLISGYNKSEVLHGVDIDVNVGEIVVMIGPNGAGKSTVLKSIFNLADVYSGKIIFKDKDITKLKTFELIELGIGYVPQGRQLFQNMTVLENLQMGAFIIEDEGVIKKGIEDVFKKFPVLKEKQNQISATLSGGQQQMLAIARALIQNPQILLLDEPSLGLSPIMMQQIFDKIIEIKNEGVAILIVEQNARQAMCIADRTYVLEGGRIGLHGGKDIIENPKIRDIYFGNDLNISKVKSC
jgi:branched-chain amino acid transport system ATP-binding protein